MTLLPLERTHSDADEDSLQSVFNRRLERSLVVFPVALHEIAQVKSNSHIRAQMEFHNWFFNGPGASV